MAKVSIKSLLDAGAHFGHQTRRWNPKMKPYIFGNRGDIYIIDLRRPSSVLTSPTPSLRTSPRRAAPSSSSAPRSRLRKPSLLSNRCGLPYVNSRWLGGMLTDFVTIRSRVARMEELEAMEADERTHGRSAQEQVLLKKELSKLQLNLNGIRNMKLSPTPSSLLTRTASSSLSTRPSVLASPWSAPLTPTATPTTSVRHPRKRRRHSLR